MRIVDTKLLLKDLADLNLSSNIRLLVLVLARVKTDDIDLLVSLTGLSKTSIRTALKIAITAGVVRDRVDHYVVRRPTKKQRVLYFNNTSDVVSSVLDVYKTKWEQKYGARYVNQRHDRKGIRSLVRELGKEEFLLRLDKYFLDSGKWVTKVRHSIQIFVKDINQYAKTQNEFGYNREKFSAEVEKLEKDESS